MIENMFVVKRNNEKEEVAFEKVQERISKVSAGLTVNATRVAQGVLTRIVDGISTTELDTIAANLAFSWSTSHPDYGTLASRIAISNHQKNSPATLLECVEILESVVDRTGNPASLLSPEFVAVVRAHSDEIESRIDYSRDFLLDYFGFKTLERAYLLRDTDRKVVERPQHLWMRVALGLWAHDLPKAFETYDMISRKLYTHATPTLFNAGTKRPQLSSCFLLSTKADSIHGIYDTLKDCALISQYGGGIGLHISDIRAQGSLIKGTGGISNGIVPMMRVFNNTARYVDQCFAPETKVYTKDGVKAIGDVGIGDYVLGSDGIYHAVRLPVRHMWNGEMLHIRLKDSLHTVRVTPEHQILAVTTASRQAEFMDAKDLHVGDYLVFPKPTHEAEIQEFSEEDCQMYALLLATGSFTGDAVTATTSVEYIQWIEDYLQKRGIEWKMSNSGTLKKIQWSIANPGWKFTNAMFQKFHTPFLHLSAKKAKTMVDMFEALGYRESALEIWYLKLKLSERWLSNGSQILVPIESIVAKTYNGLVHDFEIAEPHDYVVGGLGVAHNGGGKRNGSFAMYLEPWHADVEAFLEMKKNTGAEEERARDLFYALWIPDLFMERVDSNGDWTLFCPNEAPGLADAVGDEFKVLYERYEREGRGRKTVKAQKLWFEILDSQIETGTPYLLYKDAANLKSNQQNLGTIKSSNLCVAPETLILTDKGQYPIRDLAGQTVNVWNGEEWSEVTPLKTGENQELLHITFSNGAEIDCTPYHKFIISEDYHDKKSIANSTRIDARELRPGMKLKKSKTTVYEGNVENDFKYAYTHGFFCGDGTYQPNGIPTCSLYGEKKKLLKYLEIKSTSGNEDAQGRINTTLCSDMPRKFEVPMNASMNCRLRWLEGLVDADGTVARNGTNESIQIASINKDFMNKIRIMLIGMGVYAKVTKSQDARVKMMPDGKGGNAPYFCQTLWRTLISSSGLKQLADLGFSPKRLTFENREPQRNAEQFIQVISVENIGRIDDTYCFNESKNHAGIFNGILTGNCTEIIEYSSPEETAVCNLASLSLPAFVKNGAFDFKEFRHTVKVATRNLNRVIDVTYYPIPEAKHSNLKHRPIGLGVQGLADVFAMLNLAWESEEAADLNKRIFAHMYYAAVEASCDLAAREGVYESYHGSPAQKGKLQFDLWKTEPLQDPDLDWDGLQNAIRRIGLRNSLLVAPMPTASTSQILGNCECFEPYATHIFTRRTLAGEFIVVNNHLVKALLEAGVWSEELKNKIIGNNGSVQGLSEVPEEIQRVFKTVWEIKQKTLIDMAADRGPYICQSQSLNLFLGDPDYRKLTSMHFYTWRKGLKTGIYYLRTRAVASAQKFTVEPVQQIQAPKAQEPAECLMCSS